MSRLRQDKLSEMLAAASSAQQAAEQQSRRLEIKFARSDKGHALLRSAKLQADVVDLEAQVSQLQGDCHHKVRHLGTGASYNSKSHDLLLHSWGTSCLGGSLHQIIADEGILACCIFFFHHPFHGLVEPLCSHEENPRLSVVTGCTPLQSWRNPR